MLCWCDPGRVPAVIKICLTTGVQLGNSLLLAEARRMLG